MAGETSGTVNSWASALFNAWGESEKRRSLDAQLEWDRQKTQMQTPDYYERISLEQQRLARAGSNIDTGTDSSTMVLLGVGVVAVVLVVVLVK